MFPERFQPEPNFNRLLQALYRDSKPDHVPLFELSHDLEVVEAVLGCKLPELTEAAAREHWRQGVDFWHRLGYDYVAVWCCVPDPVLGVTWRSAEDTAELASESRDWPPEMVGRISTRQDFEQARWADPASVPTDDLETVAGLLPKGMKIVARMGAVLTHMSTTIMGFESMSIAMAEAPELVSDVAAKLGECLISAADRASRHPAVGAVIICDDLGFKTSTLISPDDLRKYVFPWHAEAVAIVHARGKPAILHSDGNVAAVMDDIIDFCRYDAKHGFEDAAMPVIEAKKLWGDRIAILGGLDVDVLARQTENEVRTRARRILDECAPGGGYALGSGNSITNYIPVNNFLAMLDEGLVYSRQPSQMTRQRV